MGVSIDIGPWTILGNTVSCHLGLTTRDPYPVDCEGHLSFVTLGDHDPFIGGVEIGSDGLARVPDAPGLGIDVDWELLQLHIDS